MRQLTELKEDPSALRHDVVPELECPSLETLTASLGVVDDTTSRSKAARQLQAHGVNAIEPLCAALRDPQLRVRLAAARSLGEVGDERAIPALVAALRELFPGRSPRRYRAVGLLAAITFPLAGISYAVMQLWEWGVSPGNIAALFGLALVLLAATGKKGLRVLAALSIPRPTQGDPCLVFSQALSRIAERCPAPELREALPLLREIAADGLQQSRYTRADSRKAARRIEELTAQLNALPVIASAPSMDVNSLPGAASGPEREV